jgi:hypothetical protein
MHRRVAELLAQDAVLLLEVLEYLGARSRFMFAFW